MPFYMFLVLMGLGTCASTFAKTNLAKTLVVIYVLLLIALMWLGVFRT